MESIEPVAKTLDQLKMVTKNGGEYWMARDIQAPLGYTKWVDFEDVIKKAQMACESAGDNPSDHFAPASKMVSIGSDAVRKIDDYYLTRYAAYLVAMNGNPRLPAIAAAQNYFAVQTRKQEISEQLGTDVSRRIELRKRVKDANKHLVGAAKVAGVQKYALFHDAGYRGLYDMGLREIKQIKRIGEKEKLLDRAGRAELAANEFRITQTEEVLKKRGVKGDLEARKTHENVGREVRGTIKRLGGTMPEDLPAEPSIKQLGRSTKKQAQIEDKSSSEKDKKELN
jgi:DNA-damage-inducible protein D